MHLHVVVIMPEHVHLLLTPLRKADGWPFPLKDILRLIKGPSAHSVNKLSGTHGVLWQDESFDHVLRSNESFDEKLEYIRQNPVRRALAANPEEYPWLWVERIWGRVVAGIPARHLPASLKFQQPCVICAIHEEKLPIPLPIIVSPAPHCLVD